MITPLTREIVDQFYDELPATVRGFAAVEGGKCLGLCGYYISDSNQVAFAKFTDELRNKPRLLIRLYRKAMTLQAMNMIAICDKTIPGASSFLKHLGFVKIEGEIWLRHYPG